MRGNRFFTVALAISASVILLLSAARVISDTEKPRFRVSVVVDESGSGRWLPFREGITQAAKDNNIELSFVTTDALVSVQQEGRIIAREIQSGADGVIAGFRSSSGTAEMLRGFMGQTLLELVDTEVESEGTNDSIGLVSADNAAIGQALCRMLLSDLPEGAAAKRLGLLCGRQQQFSVQERLSTFSEELKIGIVDKRWEIPDIEDGKEALARKCAEAPVDILVAMDNASMECAMEYLEENGKRNILLYGVGNSEKLVYGLDSGLIRGMIVPEEFSMGYHALSDLAARLNHRISVPFRREIGFRAVRRDTMYLEENQKILFPRIA